MREHSDLTEYPGHLWYEVSTLTIQVRHLVSMPGWEGGTDFHAHERNAFVEAALIHLRILDDFLRTRKYVNATHWIPSWTSKGFLTSDERKWVNNLLAHLGVVPEHVGSGVPPFRWTRGSLGSSRLLGDSFVLGW